MRCPQCGQKVPMDFASVKVASESAILLHLHCDRCNAHIVLQASLNGVEQISAPPYEADGRANASSTLKINEGDMNKLRQALQEAGGSFSQYFRKEDGKAPTDIA